jgi:flagellar protein FliO/FliZ
LVVLGRGKLKHLTLCFIISILTASGLFAQTDLTEQTRLAEQTNESAIVLGGDAAAGAPSDLGAGGSSLWPLVQMVLVLALVAGAIYALVYFLRKANRGRQTENPHIKVLASASVGSNRSVHAVSVGTQAWLIGAGEGGLRLIAEIQDREAIDAMLLDNSRAAANAGSQGFNFQALLERFAPKPRPGAAPPDATTLRQNRERLRGL